MSTLDTADGEPTIAAVTATTEFPCFDAGGSLRTGKVTGAQLKAFAGGGAAAPVLPPWVLPGVANVINMLKFGNTFSDATWTKTNVGDATFATTTTAPDGISLAVKLTASAANNNHGIQQAVVKTAVANKYRIVVTAAAAELTRIVLGFSQGLNFGTSAAYVGFDLAGGQVAYGPTTFGGAGWVGGAATITNVGTVGGKTFYRCQFDVTTSAVAAMSPNIYLDFGSGTAAQSTSVVGTGTNGVWIWQANVLPTAAWSLGTLKLNEDFRDTSTIDMGNTKVPGFAWYLGQAWPSAVQTAWNSSAPQLASNLTAANSALTIAADPSGFGNDLATAVSDGASGFIGTVYQLPAYFEFSYAFDVTIAALGKSWPTAFFIAQEFLTGAVGVGGIFEEGDIFEPQPTGAGTISQTENIHQWTAGVATSTSNSVALTISTGIANFNVQNRFGRLWLTQASTGGNGMTQVYVNGVLLPGSEVIYSTAGASAPASTPSNPTGIYTAGENHHYPFILSAGTGWPGVFDFARVYTVS